MFRSRKLRAALFALFLVFVLLGLWVFWIEPAWLTTHSFILRIPDWQPAHRGLKIAILTDLHVGSPHTGLEKLEKVVESTNDERPDLVVILGDLVIQGVVGGRFVEPEPIADVLRGLRSPLGTIAVLGNHDWWYDGARVEKALAGAGIVVLENEAHRVLYQGKPLWVVGIADLWTRKPDIEGSLRQVEGTDPVILITHNPDIFPHVPPRVNLTLAGHTHGGQVNLPVVGRLVVPSRYGQRYAMGHVVENGRHLFVGGGVGSSILPVRFRVPPEVVVLELR
ncbi:MAG TPA: metallophosphoesterase [Thermoanaerobaculia bacterium]|nr:metallophosphoesterase [Thermoanaerobaculia bacterium]